MIVAVLAVQGAFVEHEKVLDRLGVSFIELRQKKDVERQFDALILPGGESTVQGRLIRQLGLYEELKKKILDGMPVLATCAGLILLASEISNDKVVHLGTMPVIVKRNAYGRQLGSFYTEEEFEGIGRIPMTFIRAPYIESAGEGTRILARVKGNIVGVQYKNQIAVSFHPELNDNIEIHKRFIDLIS